MASVPYVRLSAFYVFYFAALGALLPYWSLYLESLGFDASQIGELIALLVGTKIIAPNIWGWIADRSGRSIQVIRTASLVTTIAFLGTFLDSGFLWMAGVTLVFSFFWNAALPQFEALTFLHLKHDPHGYSRVRLWGSIGFVVSVFWAGRFLDERTISALPPVIAVLLAGIWLASLAVPGKPASIAAPGSSTGFVGLLRKPVVVAFLVVVCLAQVAHGPYYVFYSIDLKDHGYDNGRIGQLWSLGVIAEIVLFVYMPALLKRSTLRLILLLSVLAGSVRWILIGYCVDQPLVLVFAQILHAMTFGSTHIAAVHIVHRYFRDGSHGRGQALYSSMSFGLGGMLGSYLSGAMWDHFGRLVVYQAASSVSLLAFVIAFRWLRVDEGVEADRFGGHVIEEES
ncbi:MAG: MFS transporter [Gammaproteobacteria bacterium]